MKYGRIITKDRLKYFEVADNVFAAISPNKGLSWACAGFINRGKGLVYDTFFDLPHARELKKFCVEMSGHEPYYVVNSHYNGDHTWGNQVFSGSTIIMHKEAPRERLTEVPAVWDNIIKTKGSAGPGAKWIYNEIKDFDLTGIEWQDPDILIDSDTTIMLGSTEVQILSVAPAHSASDLVVWMPKEKVVFVGDLVFDKGGAISYTAKGMRMWLKAIDFMIDELKPEVVVPGHGGVCDIEEMRLNKQYFEDILEQFDRLYTDDIDSMTLAKQFDIERYKDWLEPERLFINVNGLLKERRGEPNPPDWDYWASQMPELKAYHDEKYGVRPWNPLHSWKEE